MQFIKTEDTYPNGVKATYFPVDAETKYRCITVATPYLAQEDPKEGEEAKPRELDLSKKFFFFEFFQGQQVSQVVAIQHQNVKHAPGQKTFPVEKVVQVMSYLGEPISIPKAVVTMEAWLDKNTI